MSLQRGCEGTRNGGVEVEGRQYLLRELLQATVVLDGEGGREISLDDERASLLGRPEFYEEPRHVALAVRPKLLPRVRHQANRRSWRGQRIGDLIGNKGSHALSLPLPLDISQYRSITVKISIITA
ncbi:hypothetical protein BHE74_00008410 [Ensete ventricosum]|nr:hypothetical protein BHE74_00008410 [Ensete ventricosum]